jgi:DNA mismatch repair protein MutL
MKSIIRVLDEITINQIAAGEVIENPASVVKELVENSIDAGSTEITIEIKGGGRQLIRISDNGSGMGQDDALLCLERHATSKIHNIEELHETLTMGFRGEAVPSIASISKFTILTNPYESNEKGSMVVVDGGKILKTGPAVREKGTTMEVKSLFYNVPVRRKFQKSPAHDAADIQKVITLPALANQYFYITFHIRRSEVSDINL